MCGLFDVKYGENLLPGDVVDVVAEGVETEKQLAFLSDAGCDMIQGYYFYRPMCEEDFIRIMDNPSKTDMRLTWRKD